MPIHLQGVERLTSSPGAVATVIPNSCPRSGNLTLARSTLRRRL